MTQQVMVQQAMTQQALVQQILVVPMPLRVPLRNRTNVTAAGGPQPKKGQKSAQEELEHHHIIKAFAQCSVKDRKQGRSA